VDDLYTSLERFGRLDLIDRVATEANSYYADLPRGSKTETLIQGLRRARALRVLGDVQIQDRTRILYEPYQVFNESLRIAIDLEQRFPDNIEVIQALGASRFRLGSVMIYMGRIEEGLHELQASEKLNRAVHAREPARSHALLEVARSILLRAEIIGYMGQPEVGEFLTRDALLLLAELEGMESTRTDARRFRAQTHIRMAESLVRLGEKEKVAEYIEEARQDLRLMAIDNSYELHRRFDFARCASLEATIEMQGGSLDLANEMNRDAISEMEQVLEFSTRNVQWRRQLVQAYITQANISSASGNLEDAVEWASRAVVISRGTAYQDPDNMVSQIWLAVTHGLVGTLMHDYGHDALGLGELDSAIGILESLKRSVPTMLFVDERRALYSLNRSRALLDLGQPGEAERLLLALEEEWTQSERANRPEVRLLIANIKLALGYCLSRRGALPEATGRWEQALLISKDLVEGEEFNRYLAMRSQAAALLMLGRKEEASEIIRLLGMRGFMGEDLERLVEEGIW
jgi:tetratricopeptide (TPR) repeat protein